MPSIVNPEDDLQHQLAAVNGARFPTSERRSYGMSECRPFVQVALY